MFPKGYRAREKAAKERAARKLVSPEVREARARVLEAREAKLNGFEIGETSDVLSGRVNKPSDTPGLTQTVDGKPVGAFTTAIKADGLPVQKVDGTEPEPAPKQNDNLASLPPVNEDETGDQLASQIAALTEGAPVPETVVGESAVASAEAAKHNTEHGEVEGETENKVDEHNPAQTEGGNTEAQEEAEKEAEQAPRTSGRRKKAE